VGDLPTPTSTLSETSNASRWDAILGGRTGPSSWNQYGKGAGTTCIIAVNGWARSTTGFPADMVVSVPTPTGGGTRMIQAIINGAKQRGWFRTPVRGQLPNFRPGDIYISNHTAVDSVTKAPIDGTHVGVVLSAVLSADGKSLTVETADGGQGTRLAQMASRLARSLDRCGGRCGRRRSARRPCR